MGWSGSLTASSSAGTSITFTPTADSRSYPTDVTTYVGTYTVSTFKAPKKGVYRFQLYGSGGAQRTENAGPDENGYNTYSGQHGGAAGGQGGYTDGYLLLEENQTVYVGAGGCACAAFVSSANGTKLSAIPASNLYFVAGGGGNGGGWNDWKNYTGYNCKCYSGTKGGGEKGEYKTAASNNCWGEPGTQDAGGKCADGGTAVAAGTYGTGGKGRQWNDVDGGKYGAYCGRGGDGYYGGGGAWGSTATNGLYAYGGGGGSGYVKTSSFTYNGKSYDSTTSIGGGSASNTAGKVVVTYHAASELPIIYNDKKITKIIYNGKEITSLYYNKTKLF